MRQVCFLVTLPAVAGALPVTGLARDVSDDQAPMCLLQRGKQPHDKRGDVDVKEDATPSLPPLGAQAKPDFFETSMQELLDRRVKLLRQGVHQAPHPTSPASSLVVTHQVDKAPAPKALEDLLAQRLQKIRQGAHLVSEDELRAQDAKLRQEQQQLRQENARLQKALAEVNGLNHTAMEDLSSMLASLVQQTSHQVASAKTPPDPGADALPAGEMDVDDLYGDGPSVTMSPSKRRMTIVMMIGGAVLFVTYLVHNAYTTYKEMDGEIDDVKEFAAGVLCCGLSYSAAWSLGVVMLGAGVGFAFLWWQHMIQPFLKDAGLLCLPWPGGAAHHRHFVGGLLEPIHGDVHSSHPSPRASHVLLEDRPSPGLCQGSLELGHQ
ncbi:unnamed protein product [Effrenium voratum]|nr:unnamed protein product [Effrenium voratum]